MSSASERQRNNVRAGIFVTVAGALAIAILLALSDIAALFEQSNTYRVSFPVSSGVGDLTTGSSVRIGGLKIGRVKRVDLQRSEGASPLDRIEAEFEITSEVELYDNARLMIGQPLLGADAWISIASVGDPAGGGVRLAPGALLQGAIAPGMLTDLLGPENASRADEIVADLKDFTAFLAALDGEYDQRIRPVLEQAGFTADEVRALVARINGEDWPRWAGAIDRVFSDVHELSDGLDAAVADGRSFIANVDSTINRTNDLIDANRPEIDALIRRLNETGVDLQAIVKRFDAETIDRVHAFLDQGQQGMESFTRVGERINQQLDVIGPDLETAMANARLASEQLKLTTVEVRRSPWKLLYQPSKGEFEHELLYEAARSFAVAASDLKAASESVDRVMARHGDRLAMDPDTANQLREHLHASFERYRAAQQRLMDVLVLDQP